jgi:hypothetical protein
LAVLEEMQALFPEQLEEIVPQEVADKVEHLLQAVPLESDALLPLVLQGLLLQEQLVVQVV